MQALLSPTIERPSQLLIDVARILGAKHPERCGRDGVLEFIMHNFEHVGLMRDVALHFGPRFSSNWETRQLQVEQYIEDLGADGIALLLKQVIS